jgi:hypothetical protein
MTPINSRRRIIYLSLRYLSLIISFILSIFYTPKLGLTNRGILSFVFLITGVLIPVLSQGMRLALRGYYIRNPNQSVPIIPYFRAVLTHAVLGLILVNFILFLFLSRLDHLEPPIFFAVISYFAAAFGAQIFYDYLLSRSNYRVLNIKIVTEVSILVFVFFVLVKMEYYSLFITILLSLTVSYAVGGFLLALVFHKKTLIKMIFDKSQPDRNHLSSQVGFIKSLFPSSILIVIDRLDKFVVFLAFPISTFSKIVLAQSFLAFVKPAQDLAVNFVSSRSEALDQRKLFFWGALLSSVSGLIVFIVYYFVLDSFFGAEWKLGIDLLLLLFLLEIFKFLLSISVSRVYISRDIDFKAFQIFSFFGVVVLLSLGTILIGAPIHIVVFVLIAIYLCCLMMSIRADVI